MWVQNVELGVGWNISQTHFNECKTQLIVCTLNAVSIYE